MIVRIDDKNKDDVAREALTILAYFDEKHFDLNKQLSIAGTLIINMVVLSKLNRKEWYDIISFMLDGYDQAKEVYDNESKHE